MVAEAYGAADDFGTGTKRQTFIIDPTGRLRCQHAQNALGSQQPTRPPTAPEAYSRGPSGRKALAAWIPRRGRGGAPAPPEVAGCAVCGHLGGPPLLPAGTQPFASTILQPYIPRRWQEVNIEFGIGEFNVENHPRRVLRNFERERGQDGWQV